ncbi:MAG TPA: DUF1003 domain-containing protein [Pyrinomonadaceae bacterium]|nr:DUF1003 domain-containing protein [Pyrinomonadaceae bacterium]
MSSAPSPQMTLEALRSVPLFASLDDAAAGALCALLDVRCVPRGSCVFRTGEPGDAMYLVEDGRVRIHLHDADGEDVTLAELARGDFFGEMAILDGKPRSADATITDDARLAVLSRGDFLDFVRSNPDVALKMLSAVSERLRRTDELLRRRVSRNANEVERERMTAADRMADAVTHFGGSWKFITATALFVLLWILFNSWYLSEASPDPYPYSFLDVINGIVAALLAPIILISQNRESAKDRLRADLDYQVNLKNELAIAEVLRRLDLLESERLPTLIRELKTERSGQ